MNYLFCMEKNDFAGLLVFKREGDEEGEREETASASL